MNTDSLVLPDEVASRWESQTNVVNVVNSAGKRIGQFLPDPDPDVVQKYADLFSTDEIERRRQTKDTAITTKELMAYLQGL